MSEFDEARFHGDAARAHLESLRWPSGPVCPHCGASGHIVRITSQSKEKGKGARPGLFFAAIAESSLA